MRRVTMAPPFLGWDLGGFNFQLLADNTTKIGMPKTWLAAKQETGSRLAGLRKEKGIVRTANSAARTGKTWSFGLGVLLVILGILAIGAPFVATMAVVFMTGWLLIFAGVEQIVYALQRHEERGLFTKLLLAALYIVAGVMLLRRPVTGAITVTMIIAALLIVDGVLEIVLAIRLRRAVATGWLLTGGILSLVLGFLIWRGLPNMSIYLIGTFLGIRLIFKGIEHIRLSAYNTDLDRGDGWRRRAA